MGSSTFSLELHPVDVALDVLDFHEVSADFDRTPGGYDGFGVGFLVSVALNIYIYKVTIR